jgi:hypothetical protein
MWRACWLYSKFFETYWNMPITFNYSKRRINYEEKSTGARIWKIVITYMIGVSNILIHGFSVFAYIWVGDNVTAFLCGWDVILSIMNIVFCYLILKHGETVSLTLNFIITLEEHMACLQGKKKQNAAPDRIGRALIGTTVVLGFLPYFATLAVPLLPIPFISPGRNGLANTMEILFRRMLFFTMGHEFCRTMCALLVAIIVVVQIIKQISIDLKANVRKQYFRFSSYLNVYNGMIITIQQCTIFLSPAVAILMSAGFGFCVVSNLVTLKFRTDAIPFPFFYIFPLLAVFTPIVINIVLPEGILCHELTNDLLVKWRSSVYSVWSNRANRKYVVRRLKAVRTLDIPVGFGGFHFFYIVRDTKVAFYTNIMDSTVNAILSVPYVK